MDKKAKSDIIAVSLIVAIIVCFVLYMDYTFRTGVFQEEPQKHIKFTCYEHNYTEMIMTPKVVYPIFYNQSGYAVIDGYGGGLIRIFTECINSYAVLDDNRTVWCNGTVALCEEMYNKGGMI